jgi:hypothetical protein
MADRGLHSGPEVAEVLTVDLRRAGLLPPEYQIVSRRITTGPLQLLYLVQEGEEEGAYVGFDYATAWHMVREQGAEAIWQERDA